MLAYRDDFVMCEKILPPVAGFPLDTSPVCLEKDTATRAAAVTHGVIKCGQVRVHCSLARTGRGTLPVRAFPAQNRALRRVREARPQHISRDTLQRHIDAVPT